MPTARSMDHESPEHEAQLIFKSTNENFQELIDLNEQFKILIFDLFILFQLREFIKTIPNKREQGQMLIKNAEKIRDMNRKIIKIIQERDQKIKNIPSIEEEITYNVSRILEESTSIIGKTIGSKYL